MHVAKAATVVEAPQNLQGGVTRSCTRDRMCSALDLPEVVSVIDCIRCRWA